MSRLMTGISRNMVRLAAVLILLQILLPAFLSGPVTCRDNTTTLHEPVSKVVSPSFLKEIEEESEKSDKSERHVPLLDFVRHFSNLDTSFEKLSTWRDQGAKVPSISYFTLYRMLRI